MDAFHLSNAQVSEFQKHGGVVFEQPYKQLAADHGVNMSEEDDDDDLVAYLYPDERRLKNQ